MTLAQLLRVSRQRVRSVSRKNEMDAELDRELAFHLEQLVQENLANGMAPAEARIAARRTLGNMGLLQEQCRDQRRTNWLHDLWQDTLYGLRMLRNNPGFTFVAVASLALGIGANTAVLGTIDAALRGQLPYPNADRLVRIHTFPLDNPQQTNNASVPDYDAWKERSRSFESIGASLANNQDFGTERDGRPAERLAGHAFNAGLFRTLGIQPMLGRLFTEEDYLPGHAAYSIVISHRLWQTRFASDPDILNKRLRLGSASRAIVGVMPPYFPYAAEYSDYWIPMAQAQTPAPLRDSARYFIVTARLNPGVTLQQAQAEISAIAADLVKENPARHQGWGVRVQSLRQDLYGWTWEPLLTLEAVVVFVLLIACANVAGLLLARASSRTQEIAMRVALGAGRSRIIRQLLTESVLLSMLGGLVGLLVAWWYIGVQGMNPPPGAPRLAPVGLDYRLLGLNALTSLLTGISFGLVPAIAAFKLDLIGALKKSSRGVGQHASRQRMRGALVATQVALALILLTGTGLLLKSFFRLAARDYNFDPKNLLSFEFRIPQQSYMHDVGAYRDFRYFEISPPPSQTLERVLDRLRAIPGVESVAGLSHQPINSLILPRTRVRLDSESDASPLDTVYFLATPNFFTTMRAGIVRGRDFNTHDRGNAPWVAIVNESAARRFWPGQNPIGKRITIDTVPEEQPRVVVGLVRDIPTRTRQTVPDPIVYASYLQQPSHAGPWGNMMGQMTFLLRASGDAAALAPLARAAAAEVDPNIPLAAVATEEQFIRGGRTQDMSAYVFVLGVFSLVATALAAIGIYGVMAYAVAHRTHEIGVRMALGARASQVVASIGRNAMQLIAAGLIAGLAGSLALTRLIASQLWGVTPWDPATFAGTSLLLLAIALLACYFPSRRATRVDPTVALRAE